MSVNQKINSFFSPIDKVSNETFSGKAQQEIVDRKALYYDVDVAKKGTKPINIQLAVWNEHEEKIPMLDEEGEVRLDSNGDPIYVIATYNHQLNLFDRVVHDAIVSIVSEGVKDFTPIDILSVICGKVQGQRIFPTEEQIADIDLAVRKIAETRIILDFKNEAIKYSEYGKKFKKRKNPKSGEDATFTINENLVSLKIQKYLNKCKGKEIVYHYTGDEMPALYRYSNPKNQVLKVGLKEKENLLNVPLKFSVDEEKLKTFLLHKINAMHSKNVSNALHIETILKSLNMIETSIYELDKYKRNKVYGKIETILNYWQESDKLIKDWHWEPALSKAITDTSSRPLKKGKLVIQIVA